MRSLRRLLRSLLRSPALGACRRRARPEGGRGRQGDDRRDGRAVPPGRRRGSSGSTSSSSRRASRVARFSHAWDRYTGDYRRHGHGQDRRALRRRTSTSTRRPGGVSSTACRPRATSEAKRLENAYGRFINDTYWLLAPWKIFDPGVHLTYDGEKPCPGGGTCDVLKLSFENVGLTPKDMYWLWVTRDGRHMVQWQYVLGGASEPPTTVAWKDWQNDGRHAAVARQADVRRALRDPLRERRRSRRRATTRSSRRRPAP